ncbi:hypothetical protein ACJMK2_034388 [Sinanodonta woodiana]|uniref:Uncharacterized protein n=1 Tax=Sinanodonta woodiana TaxID=1069815 RepID=A0ABD3WUW7_SINWO
MSKEKELIRRLIKDYEQIGKMGRPIAEENGTLTVSYGLSLIQILDLDERNQVLSTNVWATYVSINYGADTRLEERRDALIVVEHDGSVVWIPQAIFKSSCPIDIKKFPFDVQTCKMKFGSWTYDGSKLDLQLLYETTSGFEFSDYIKSNEWDIVSSSAVRTVMIYTCCPEPYVDLTFTLKIRRQAAFYNYILILPCILLSSVTMVLFWLPPESPAKMQLGMNIFVAFFVLLLLLAESTPPAASSIPLIGAYYCLNMIMITLSTFFSAVVVNLYFHGARSVLPDSIRKIMTQYVARIFCMHDQVVDPQTKHQTESKHGIVLNNRDKVHSELPHDTTGYFEMQTDDPCKGLLNGNVSVSKMEQNNQDTSTPANETNRINSQLEKDVKEIKSFMKTVMDKTAKKEATEKIAREWKFVSLILDRLFFFMYLLITVVSFLTIFDFALFAEN